LNVLKADLSAILGDRLEALYRYGSQARGGARLDSDIDVLVVLRDDFPEFELV
jgi:predicted nucleotidyltransferase